MIWMHYGYHDYMDEKPGDAYKLFESEEQAKDWAARMNKHYSGGTTWIIGPAKQSELLAYAKGLQLDELTTKNINNPNYYKHD